MSTKTYRYAVVVAYAYADKARGDVLSKHTTYDLAVKAAKRTGQYDKLAIRDVVDLIKQ